MRRKPLELKIPPFLLKNSLNQLPFKFLDLSFRFLLIYKLRL